MVAVFWLRAATAHASYGFHRGEPAANIAGGPTRPDKAGCVILHALGAREVNPLVHGLWYPMADDALSQQDILVGLD